jgi:hypothetical protein
VHSVSYFTLRAASYRGLRDGSRDKRRERGGGHATRRRFSFRFGFACRWQERLPRLIGGDFGRSLSHEQRVRINSSSSVEHYSGKSDRSLGAPHPEETANRTPILSQLQLPTGLVQKITSGVSLHHHRNLAIVRYTASSHPPGVASPPGWCTRICGTSAALDLTVSDIVHPPTIHRQHLCRDPT